MGLKKKLVRKYHIASSFSALEISENAYLIYDWLAERKVENPNASSVDFFDYAAQTLGIPYQLLTESYFTQTPLTEEEVFNHSTKFNAKLNEKKCKKASSQIKVPNFSQKIEEYFKEKEVSELLKRLTIPETNFSKNNLKRYDLNMLFAEIVKSVWENIAANSKAEEEERLKFYFRKYFYKNKQAYNSQFLSLVKDKLIALIEKEEEGQTLEEDSALLKLLSQEPIELERLNEYVRQSQSSLSSLTFYKQFLVHLSHAFYLSPQNIFLLMGQLPYFTVVKTSLEWKYCEQEIKPNARPIFLFGENAQSLIPFFDFKDTQGEMSIASPCFDLRNLILALKKTYHIEVRLSKYLGERNHKILNDHTLLISESLNESYTFQELIVASTEVLYPHLSPFEKASVDFCILKFLGIDYHELDKIYESLKPKAHYFFDSLIKIQSCVNQFNTQITTRSLVEKEEVDLENFEQEIKICKEMERNALENIQTVKQEKAESQATNSKKNMVDLGQLIELELSKNGSATDEEGNKK
ncbi:hypothetical protein ACN9TI_00030 [Lactococcus lactis]